MGGRAGEPCLTQHAHGRLEANIVAFGLGEGAVVLVSVDTLFLGRELTESILKACATRFNVPPERVLALASHTHFAPMMDESKPNLGRAERSEVVRVAYRIKTAIEEARSDSVAVARVGRGSSDRAVNRRRRWRWPTLVRLLGKVSGEIYIDDNPLGPRDAQIRTCVWISATGAPLAAFWSFACHPVAFPEPDTASADYIGVVRETLRKRLGAQVPVIFAPGCMGDVRPRSPSSQSSFRRAIGLAIFGQSALAFDRTSWDVWSQGLADEVIAIDGAGSTAPIDPGEQPARMVRVPISTIFDGSTSTPELHGKAVHVPGVGRVVALSCEPVTEIARLVASGDDDLVLGYEGDVFGYLPTDAMVAEGGYEAEGFMRHFGLNGSFKPGLDTRIEALGHALRPVQGRNL